MKFEEFLGEIGGVAHVTPEQFAASAKCRLSLLDT
jgi:hypothetical protein